MIDFIRMRTRGTRCEGSGTSTGPNLGRTPSFSATSSRVFKYLRTTTKQEDTITEETWPKTLKDDECPHHGCDAHTFKGSRNAVTRRSSLSMTINQLKLKLRWCCLRVNVTFEIREA